MYTEPINHLILLKRVALEMSQAELADHLLMDIRTLQRKETGLVKVSVKQDSQINNLLLASPPSPTYSGQDIAALRVNLGWTISEAAEKFYRLPEEWEQIERSQHAPSALHRFLSLAHDSQDEDGNIPRPTVGPHRASSDDSGPSAKPEHLKFIRKEYGLNQAQLAVLLGVSRATVNRYESGDYVIPRHMLVTLRGVAATLKERKFNQED
ncbi:MAG: hypothetical protein UU59_C0051G0010 [candidate division WWE3 bacterium GW2011_GWE1_41_27]|uniref:HTH cro/C1-type domain-containing protein n=1 Tax=candidate division WWE3 bacterium GW2011_GWE1_41_27 TaxID=1619131 RepID=A0A0G0VWR9_UNCKA|nr:MAG: hypothetical protein UU59_C0051G0010 [candidate division WWE3 bacterium GW2011_GWE1_41_27]